MNFYEALVVVPATLVACALILIDAQCIPPLKKWFHRRHK